MESRLVSKLDRFYGSYPQRWAQISLLLAFCFFLYFLNLGQWDLWNPDEPRYAQVGREIVNGGDWILMHFNGKTYSDKPPLFFWLIAFSSYLWQGFTSFSARFPSALFGTLTVLLTFFLGKKLYTPRVGFLSGLILATSLDFAYLSTRANIDATLTFFTTASFLCFIQWVQGGQAESERGRRHRLSIYGFYVAMAFATLTKGPVGFILPLLLCLTYLAVQQDWKRMKQMSLLPGMLLFAVIVLSWYLPAVLEGGKAYLDQTLFHHTLERYAKGWSHVKPIYYYFYTFPLEFLPWILFIPAAMVYGFSKDAFEKRREFLFLLLWFVVVFLFFSISKGKRGLYVLPLYPAASLMVGKLWDDFLSTPMENFQREWILFPLYGFMGLALVAGAAVPWVVSRMFPSYLPYSLPVVFLVVGGSLAMFALSHFKHHGALLFLLIGVMAGGFFYTLRVVFPLVNPYKSARFICQEVTSKIRPGEQLGLYGGVGSGPYNFYTGIVPIQEMEKKEDLFNFLQSSRRVFCFLTLRDFSSFYKMEGGPTIELITQRKVENDDMVLISNR